MNLHIDLGQIIIASLIAIVGYLVKNEVSSFKEQLANHEELIIRLVGDVQRLIGRQDYWDGINRRSNRSSRGESREG